MKENRNSVRCSEHGVERHDRCPACQEGRRIAELESALKEIVEGYDRPPYNEFDWIAWRQRAGKALGEK